MGEWFILHATSLGLSTCWANAAVSMSGVLQRVSVTAGESVICLVPFGYPGKPTRTPKTRKRMKWKSICPQYETGELEPWQMAAFEAAKWAPSALNGQPWQFAVRGNQIVVRKRNNMAGVSRWMEMDFGVVMSHIHLIAAASGHPGVWTWGTYPEIATYTFEEKAD